jgi:hypothetical protein
MQVEISGQLLRWKALDRWENEGGSITEADRTEPGTAGRWSSMRSNGHGENEVSPPPGLEK